MTDFGDELASLGTIHDTSFNEAYAMWQQTELNQVYPVAVLPFNASVQMHSVKNAYYPEVDFLKQSSRL